MDELKAINHKDLDRFIFKDIITKSKVYKVYDGDTISVIFEYKGEYIKYSCRLNGIDTPEMRDKNLEVKKLAYEARDFLRHLILDKIINIELIKFDKYGRLLVNAYTLEGESLSDIMLINNYAKKYDGGTKYDWNLYFT